MAKNRIHVVSAAIVKDGRYLITQRNENAVLPLLWEFPGGKVEEQETETDALKRELKWRLGIDAEVCEHLATHEQEYANYVVVQHLYRCNLGPSAPSAVNVHNVQWVTSREFDQFEFAPADENSMNALLFSK